MLFLSSGPPALHIGSLGIGYLINDVQGVGSWTEVEAGRNRKQNTFTMIKRMLLLCRFLHMVGALLVHYSAFHLSCFPLLFTTREACLSPVLPDCGRVCTILAFSIGFRRHFPTDINHPSSGLYRP